MIEVEEGGLRALEQDAVPGLERLVDHQRGVRDQRQDPGREAVEQFPRAGDVRRDPLRAPAEQLAVPGDQVGEPLVAILRMAQIPEPEAPAGRLVGVRRADAPAGGADPVLPEPFLLPRLDRPVHREDDLGPVREEQVGRGIAPGRLQHLHFLEEGERVHDAAVADDGADARVEHRGGKQVQDELPASGDDRVSRVVAAPEPHHRVEARGEDVDELALPLVTPLGPDDRQSGHSAEPYI